MESNAMNKRIAAIHDLSGFGKCSLTIILPILSACGLEACPLPTAFLSSHTGGLPGFTHRDLTPDLLPAARQWSELKLRFDGIYSGFLGSLEQIQLQLDFQGVGNFRPAFGPGHLDFCRSLYGGQRKALSNLFLRHGPQYPAALP